MKSITIDVEVFAAIWSARRAEENDENEILARLLGVTPSAQSNLERPKANATVSATRLTFKKKVIDELDDEEVYECIFPEGVFQMTKMEFKEVFKNVVESASYNEGGSYNYATTPKRALKYKVSSRN